MKQKGILYVLVVSMLLLFGCSEEANEDIEGNTPIFIELISFTPSPVSFPVDSGTQTAIGLFAYIDPYAALSIGVLLIKDCGQDPLQREEIPFLFVTAEVGGFGTFGAQFALNTNCDPGEYTARFFVMDKNGNTSSPIELHYEIVPAL